MGDILKGLGGYEDDEAGLARARVTNDDDMDTGATADARGVGRHGRRGDKGVAIVGAVVGVEERRV